MKPMSRMGRSLPQPSLRRPRKLACVGIHVFKALPYVDDRDIGERSNAVLRTATGERSDAVLRTATGERSDAVLRTATGERSDAVLRTATGERSDAVLRTA